MLFANLTKLSNGIFEPFLIIGTLGFLLLGWRQASYHCKQQVFFVALYCSALLWRICIPMSSSRYFALLILFYILASAYAMEYWRRWSAGKFFRNTRHGLLRRLIGSLFLVILTILSVGKDLRRKSDNRIIIDVAHEVVEFSRTMCPDYIAVISGQKEKGRIHFYSQLQTDGYESLNERAEDTGWILYNLLWRYRYRYDNVFVVLKEDWDVSALTYADLNCQEVEWKHISSLEIPGNKKKIFRIYHFSPEIKTVIRMEAVELDTQPEESRENLLRNGNFEKAIEDSAYYELVERYFMDRKLQNPVLPGNLIPKEWEVWGIRYHSPHQGATLSLTQENAISGTRSLLMESISLLGISSYQKFTAETSDIQFLLKGEPGSEISIGFHLYDGDKKWNDMIIFREFSLSESSLQAVAFKVPRGVFLNQKFYQLIILLRKGKILIDDMKLEVPEISAHTD